MIRLRGQVADHRAAARDAVVPSAAERLPEQDRVGATVNLHAHAAPTVRHVQGREQRPGASRPVHRPRAEAPAERIARSWAKRRKEFSLGKTSSDLFPPRSRLGAGRRVHQEGVVDTLHGLEQREHIKRPRSRTGRRRRGPNLEQASEGRRARIAGWPAGASIRYALREIPLVTFDIVANLVDDTLSVGRRRLGAAPCASPAEPRRCGGRGVT